MFQDLFICEIVAYKIIRLLSTNSDHDEVVETLQNPYFARRRLCEVRIRKNFNERHYVVYNVLRIC